VPHDYLSGSFDIAQAYYLVGDDQKSLSILAELWKKSTQYMRYYISLGEDRIKAHERYCKMHISILQSIANLTSHVDEKKGEEYWNQLSEIYQQYVQVAGVEQQGGA
jgi:hypothetical protein